MLLIYYLILDGETVHTKKCISFIQDKLSSAKLNREIASTKWTTLHLITSYSRRISKFLTNGQSQSTVYNKNCNKGQVPNVTKFTRKAKT